MKKTIFFTVAATLAIFAGIVSCKKDKSMPESANNQAVYATSINDITVNDYGFLVFSSFEQLREYDAFLSGHTHAEIKQFHQTIGFRSQGQDKYGASYDNQMLSTEQEHFDYSSDANGMIQVMGVVMKTVNANTFILAMNANVMTPANYAEISSGVFNPQTMNRFVTITPEDEKETNVLQFMATTPNGHSDPPPTGGTANRPFWGHRHTETPVTNGAGGTLYKWCCDTYYVFWVQVSQDCGPC